METEHGDSFVDHIIAIIALSVFPGPNSLLYYHSLFVVFDLPHHSLPPICHAPVWVSDTVKSWGPVQFRP